MEIDDKYRDPIDLFNEIVLKGRETIYVCGYPRSGTTWITRLLAQCLDSPSLSWGVKNDVRKPRFRDPAVEGLHRRGPYVVRHGHWKARQPEMRDKKVLVVHRDPRDVAVSCYHYFNFHKPDGGGMERCVNQICGAKGKGLAFVNVNGRGWGGYTAAWLERSGSHIAYGSELASSRVISVRYEDFAQQDVLTAAQHCSDSANRIASDIIDPDDVLEVFGKHSFSNRPKDKTMRRGVVGGWRDELPERLARKIEDVCGPEMERLGYL